MTFHILTSIIDKFLASVTHFFKLSQEGLVAFTVKARTSAATFCVKMFYLHLFQNYKRTDVLNLLKLRDIHGEF